MTSNKKVIQSSTDQGKLVNACLSLANLITTINYYHIWRYQLIHSVNNEHKWLSLVCACPVLQDTYQNQSTCNFALAGYFTVPKTMNSVFEQFIFKWCSINHFVTSFILLCSFSLIVVLHGLKDLVRGWSSAYPDMLSGLISWMVLE